MEKAKVSCASKPGNEPEERGCRCRRSACRKKYCECFRKKALCTAACKCIGCGNKTEEILPENGGPSGAAAAAQVQSEVKEEKEGQATQKKGSKAKAPKPPQEIPEVVIPETPTPPESEVEDNPPVPEEPIFLNFINADIVSATVECALAQAQECIDCGLSNVQTERMVLEEFDRCLVGILAAMEITEDVTIPQSSSYQPE